MKKMPTLFEKDFSQKKPLITRTVQAGCEWVLEGQGQAYIKRDGTSCAVIKGELFKRFDLKPGRTLPEGAIPCCPPDTVTGHHPHWVPVGPNDKWHHKAYTERLPEGSYELCGPHVNGNPERFDTDRLVPHTSEEVPGVPRDFDGLAEFLKTFGHEGLVFHHTDGRMCKIRRKDFGFSWPLKENPQEEDPKTRA